MKKVLLTTSALVAFAGYAAADVSFGGEVTVGYNDIDEGGLFIDGSLDLTGTAEFDGGVSVEVTYGYDLYAGTFDNFPTVTVTTPWATLTVGDVEYAGTDMFAAVDGMATNAGDETEWREINTEMVARVDATFGGFTVGVSMDTGLFNPNYATNALSIGAMGEFGAFSFTAGYDMTQNHAGTPGDDLGQYIYGFSVGTSFGGFDVDAAYQYEDHNGSNSIGLAMATTFGAAGVSAYYAINSQAPDAYGVAVDYATGPVTVGAYWDGDDSGASNFGVDVGYEVNENISVAVGWDEGDGVYAYGLMQAGAATVGAGWANYSDAGPEEIRQGVSVWVTMPF
ncbi:MAG: porin [Paracoccaceae bacterium]